MNSPALMQHTDISLPARPFVSVIVPTHGRAALLRQVLDSLVQQDWPKDHYEIIVVHNYSDDGTHEVVQRHSAASVVPIIYFQTDFSRPGPSRQFGSEQARGDVLAFIDDDCTATSGWISAGVSGFAEGFALVQGRTLPRPDQPRRLLEKTISIVSPTPYFETCNIFYSAAVFRSVGGFPEQFRAARSGEDTALGWAIRQAGHASGFSEQALVYHEVFAISYRAWVAETSVLTMLPYLARSYPEFRRHLFLRIFLNRVTAAFDGFVLGLAGGVLLHPVCFLLCLPYVGLRFIDGGRHRKPHILLARLFFALPRQAMMAWHLIANSVRARSMVV
jgi:glycosyltransferase involved in cell wall biosynthesis